MARPAPKRRADRADPERRGPPPPLGAGPRALLCSAAVSVRLPLALAALALVACHPTELLPPPPADDLGAGLLLLVEDGEVSFVHAFTPGDPSYPSFARRDVATLVFVGFGCGLDVLDLEPGPQALRAEPRPTLDLPAPTRIARLEVGPDAAWAPMDSMSEAVEQALLRLDVRELNLCQQRDASFEALLGNVDVPDGTDFVLPTFVAPAGGGAHLVGTLFAPDIVRTSTTGYGAYRLSTDDQVVVWDEVRDLGPLLAGLTLDGADMLLAGPETLWRGHPERGFEVVTSTSFAPRPRRMVLASDPAGDEVYLAVSADLRDGIPQRRWLLELTDAGWRTLRTVDVDDGRRDRVDVAWLGPGEALAVGFSERSEEATVVSSGQVEQQLVGPGLRFTDVVPGLGPVVAGQGQAYVRDAEGWRGLETPGAVEVIQQIVALDGEGFGFFGWHRGAFAVGQVLEGLGDCGFSTLIPQGARFVVRDGPDRWLATIVAPAGGKLRYARVRRVEGVRPLTCD